MERHHYFFEKNKERVSISYIIMFRVTPHAILDTRVVHKFALEFCFVLDDIFEFNRSLNINFHLDFDEDDFFFTTNVFLQ